MRGERTCRFFAHKRGGVGVLGGCGDRRVHERLTYTDGGSDDRYFNWALNSTTLVGGSSIGTRSFRGHLAELVLYDRLLTPAEHMKVGAYLQQKYGIAGAYPVAASGTVIFIR